MRSSVLVSGLLALLDKKNRYLYHLWVFLEIFGWEETISIIKRPGCILSYVGQIFLISQPSAFLLESMK